MQYKDVQTEGTYTSSYSDTSGYTSFNVQPAFGSQVRVLPGSSTSTNPRGFNPWSYSVSETSALIGSYTSYYVPSDPEEIGWTSSSSGSFGSASAELSYVEQSLIDIAYNQALESLYSQLRGNIDLSVDLLQANQTRKMFGALTELERYVQQRRWQRLPRYAKLIQAPANLYLSYIYGLKPLVGTVYDLAVESFRFNQNRIRTIKGRGRKVDQVNTVSDGGLPSGRRVLRGTQSVDVEICVRMALPPDDNYSPARLSSLNPVSIAWELLPYSFVVDWAVDVGGFLRSAETAFLYGTQFQTGYERISVRTDSSETVTTGWSDSSGRYGGFGSYSGRHMSLSYSRSVLGSLPYPRRPRWNVNLGSSRLFAAASLLAQFLGRR